MRIIIDIGDSSADVPAVLRAMDGDGLELTGVDGSHVGCRVAGIVPDEVKTGETYRMSAWLPLEEA